MSHSMVGRYTQTRQRRLRGKTVNTSHGRRYKEALAVPCRGGQKTESTFHNVKRKTEQEEKKKKDKNENREEKKEN